MWVGAAGLPLASAAAQEAATGGVQPEVRMDLFAARRSALELGAGVNVAASRNVRLSLVAGAGAARADGSTAFAGRLDAAARFILDPFFTSRWAPYAGGGLSLRYARAAGSDDWRPEILVLVGLEGPRLAGSVPFFEAGFGGGFRIGAGLRRALPGRR